MVVNQKAASNWYFDMNRLQKKRTKPAQEMAQNLAEEQAKAEEVELT